MKEDLLKAIGQVDDTFLQSCDEEWDSLQNQEQAEENADPDRTAKNANTNQPTENEVSDRKVFEFNEMKEFGKISKTDKNCRGKKKNLAWRHFAGLAACACLVLLIFALVPGWFFQTSENSDSARLYSSEEEVAEADEEMQEASARNGEEDQAESESQLAATEQADQDGKEIEGEKEYTWTETGICLADITVNGKTFHLMTAEEAESYDIEEAQLSNVNESMCGQEIGQVEACVDEPVLIGASVYTYKTQKDNADICILKVEDSYWFYVKD